jgi:transposase
MPVAERRHICETVARLGNDNLKAARVLGIGKTTLYRKLKQYGFGRIADLEPAISGSADQLSQLAILKKQAAAVLDKMKQFERRIAGRS